MKRTYDAAQIGHTTTTIGRPFAISWITYPMDTHFVVADERLCGDKTVGLLHLRRTCHRLSISGLHDFCFFPPPPACLTLVDSVHSSIWCDKDTVTTATQPPHRPNIERRTGGPPIRSNRWFVCWKVTAISMAECNEREAFNCTRRVHTKRSASSIQWGIAREDAQRASICVWKNSEKFLLLYLLAI